MHIKSNKLKIGENSFVGAGSVVTNNVMNNWVVYGNPAKFKKLNTTI